MSTIPRLLIFSAIIKLLPNGIAFAAAEDNVAPAPTLAPMMMVKSTLKSWRSMYNSYREEVNLGYCWADYFLDINKLVNALTGPRIAGVDTSEESSSSTLLALLRGWFDPEKYRERPPVGIYWKSDRNEGNIDDETQQDAPGEIFPSLLDPDDRIDEDESLSSLTETPATTAAGRGLSDLFISVLGLNTPPGVGSLMLGVRTSPAVIVLSRIIGTFFRVGKQILETIEKTQFLACTKNYLMVKAFRWIDS